MDTVPFDYDETLEKLARFVNQAVAEEEQRLLDRGMAAARAAMQEGQLSPQQFHTLDILYRRIKRPEGSRDTVAKSVDAKLRTGHIGGVEAFQRLRMLNGPEAQLGDPSTWFSCWNRPAPAQQ